MGRCLRVICALGAFAGALMGVVDHTPRGGCSIDIAKVARAGCAFQNKAFGRFCNDLTEQCSPGCAPTSCADRVRGLTVPNGPLQLVTFFQGAVNRCKDVGNKTQVFECAWGMGVRAYPDLANDQCTKTGLYATFDSIAFNNSPQSFKDPEVCDLPKDGSVPPGYFALMAPRHLIEGADAPAGPGGEFNKPPAHNIGLNEGRVNSKLRQVARVADPLNCSLPLSAKQFAAAKSEKDKELARAFADLSVTGRLAWLGRPASHPRGATKGFKAEAPTVASYCRALPKDLAKGCPAFEGRAIEGDLVAGCEQALNRAYEVANFLRAGEALPKKEKDALRDSLKWIAVSGEDDQPHRPVNVPSSPFPQYDIEVDVPAPLAQAPNPKSVLVRSRFTVAQFKAPPIGTAPAKGLTIPSDPVLSINKDAEILLFVHGMDSRAEEADDITQELFRQLAAKNSQRNVTVISLDLPTSGYAENLDYERVSPLSAIGAPKLTVIPSPIPIPIPPQLYPAFAPFGVPPVIPPLFPVPLPDFQGTGQTPLLDFIETFIVKFVETLDTKSPGVKSKIKAVMGGSLGGNMTFRLGRRQNVPWLPKFIVWSPASIWNSLAEGMDILKHIGPRSAWENADKSRDPSDLDHLSTKNAGNRKAFFIGWDNPILPVIIPMAQSDTWQSDHYPCKKSGVAGARLDRHETYDPRFLAWHWRLGGEQLIFSHQTIDGATHEPRFKSNTKRMLLVCGVEDNITFNDICGATQRTAPFMMTTPGRALFLDKTGHSVDNERREFFGKQVISFLDETAPAGPLPVSTPLAPLPPMSSKKTLGELCLLPAECETSRCSGLPLRCEAQPPPPQKKSNGQPCALPSDCLSNRCIITCQAQPEKKANGVSCVLPEECLSNRCNGLPLKCEEQPSKKPNGQSCLMPAECESNRCSGLPLRCEAQPPPPPPPPAKKPNGQSCLMPSECVSNRCSGFPLRCEAQPPPPPPPPPKKGRGESCFMPGECASNTCNFWRKCE